MIKPLLMYYTCGCVGDIDAEPLCSKSDLNTVYSHCSPKQSILNETVTDPCVFTLTFDEDDTTVQAKKCECARCEFFFTSLCLLHNRVVYKLFVILCSLMEETVTLNQLLVGW